MRTLLAIACLLTGCAKMPMAKTSSKPGNISSVTGCYTGSNGELEPQWCRDWLRAHSDCNTCSDVMDPGVVYGDKAPPFDVPPKDRPSNLACFDPHFDHAVPCLEPTCEDNHRVLLSSEDGKHHCYAFFMLDTPQRKE